MEKLSSKQITKNAIKAAVDQYNKFLKNKKEKGEKMSEDEFPLISEEEFNRRKEKVRQKEEPMPKKKKKTIHELCKANPDKSYRELELELRKEEKE